MATYFFKTLTGQTLTLEISSQENPTMGTIKQRLEESNSIDIAYFVIGGHRVPEESRFSDYTISKLECVHVILGGSASRNPNVDPELLALWETFNGNKMALVTKFAEIFGPMLQLVDKAATLSLSDTDSIIDWVEEIRQGLHSLSSVYYSGLWTSHRSAYKYFLAHSSIPFGRLDGLPIEQLVVSKAGITRRIQRSNELLQNVQPISCFHCNNSTQVLFNSKMHCDCALCVDCFQYVSTIETHQDCPCTNDTATGPGETFAMDLFVSSFVALERIFQLLPLDETGHPEFVLSLFYIFSWLKHVKDLCTGNYIENIAVWETSIRTLVMDTLSNLFLKLRHK